MTEIEIVRGSPILRLLTELHQDKRPLKISWKDTDAEYSTQIADIRKRRRKLHFRLNAQEDFLATWESAVPQQLQFEFVDKENITYVFETGPAVLSRKAVWIAFPEFIRRYQRRSLFRLDAPPGTRLFFNIDDDHHKLLVINVSLGGTLGVIVSLTKQMEDELTQHKLKTLENVDLVFPAKEQKAQDSTVRIRSCRIKRQKKNPLTQKLEYAIEFVELDEDEQEKLTQLFYRWQRKYLRRRKLMAAWEKKA
jgi:c-di-GMP-binding flagellar brake protein YcgR